MEHIEAVKQMAAERYLLDELTPELREAFEEHFFDCRECALDLRAASAFVEEAKAQLPHLAAAPSAPSSPAPAHRAANRTHRFFWLRPAFAVPAFALLLALIGYQNVAIIPGLQSEAAQPRLLPWTLFHAGTRGASRTSLPADRKQGAVLLIDLPQDSAYTSYSFDLYDPHDRRFWTQTAATAGGNGTFSLVIPGPGLQQGSYTLVISGMNPQGERTEIDRRVLDIHF